jgi:hypothetical protein
MNPHHYTSGNPEAFDDDLTLQAERNSASANLFIRTALAGRCRGASNGERIAHRLAVALHEIGDDLALLDETTLEGFVNIVRASAGPWPTEDAKYQVIQAIAVAGSKAPIQKSMNRTTATADNSVAKRAARLAVPSRTQVHQVQCKALKLDQVAQRAAHHKRIRMSNPPARQTDLHEIGESKQQPTHL